LPLNTRRLSQSLPREVLKTLGNLTDFRAHARQRLLTSVGSGPRRARSAAVAQEAKKISENDSQFEISVPAIAVHAAARVMAESQPTEVLVSRVVTDLVAGAGLKFSERGSHELKCLPGRWDLFAASV
jgi:hypothetical protein